MAMRTQLLDSARVRQAVPRSHCCTPFAAPPPPSRHAAQGETATRAGPPQSSAKDAAYEPALSGPTLSPTQVRPFRTLGASQQSLAPPQDPPRVCHDCFLGQVFTANPFPLPTAPSLWPGRRWAAPHGSADLTPPPPAPPHRHLRLWLISWAPVVSGPRQSPSGHRA